MKRRTIWILAGIAFFVCVVPVIQKWRDSRPRHGPPPSRQVCEEWARKVERTISAGDPSFLDGTLDMRAVWETATDGLNFSRADRKTFMDSVMKGDVAELGKNICEALNGEGSYKFLRLVKDRGRLVARFRMYSGQGMNYHDYLLASDTKGQVVAVDLYIYSLGENLSQTFHRVASVAAAEGKTAGGGKGGLVEGSRRAKAMARHFREGKAEEALQDYDSLPAALKQEKSVMLLRVTAAGQVSDDLYASALEEYQQRFPDDASADLVSIKLLFLKGKFDEVHKALDRLEAQVGADAALDRWRANCWMSMDDLPKAREAALRAVREEPDFQDAYWTLVTVALKQKDFPEVARVLTVLEKELKAQLPDLQETPIYADFLKSDEYAKWARSRSDPAGGTRPAAAP